LRISVTFTQQLRGIHKLTYFDQVKKQKFTSQVNIQQTRNDPKLEHEEDWQFLTLLILLNNRPNITHFYKGQLYHTQARFFAFSSITLQFCSTILRFVHSLLLFFFGSFTSLFLIFVLPKIWKEKSLSPKIKAQFWPTIVFWFCFDEGRLVTFNIQDDFFCRPQKVYE